MANVITPEFRVSYPTVFAPKLNDLNGQMEYSLVALFPKGADLTELKKIAAAVVIEKFGADKSKHPPNLRSPFRDQGEKEKDGKMPDGLEKGAIFMTLKAKQRPGLVNGNRQVIIDETEFYAGCYARAQINAYYYDKKGNKGVSFGLNNVQKTRDGDSLSGRVKAEDAFEAVAPEGGAEAGSGDDIFK